VASAKISNEKAEEKNVLHSLKQQQQQKLSEKLINKQKKS